MPSQIKHILWLLAGLLLFGQVYAEENKQSQPIHLYSNLLPNTDGYGLLPKPPAFTPEESKKLFEAGSKACDSNCVTPFGQKLGVADGAVGRSNCSYACIRPEYSFLNLTTGNINLHKEDPNDPNLHYIGVAYQCVEYSRKWWMINRGITYGSVDSAYEILYLTEAKDIRSKKVIPLGRSINGTAKRPPKRGDLVIYHPTMDDPKWRYGHVAVVIESDLEKGTVSLAEENYNNKPWDNPDVYSRKIQLFQIGGRYTLLDVPSNEISNNGGAQISGWIYPLTEKM